MRNGRREAFGVLFVKVLGNCMVHLCYSINWNDFSLLQELPLLWA